MLNKKTNIKPIPILYRFLLDTSSDKQIPSVTIDEYKEIIRLSLQTLLNTKFSHHHLKKNWSHALNSGLGYGINHLASMKENIKLNKSALCEQIKSTISLYETRLQNITVTQSDALVKNNVIGITIQGSLIINNHKQIISYESYINPTEQRISILKGLSL